MAFSPFKAEIPGSNPGGCAAASAQLEAKCSSCGSGIDQPVHNSGKEVLSKNISSPDGVFKVDKVSEILVTQTWRR